MTANSRTLEIKVISAENLQLDRKPIKKNTSVTVQTHTNNQFLTTEMDTEGDAYPLWNEKLVLDLPTYSKSITVEVQCKASSCVRTIGMATIPASDFVGGYVPEGSGDVCLCKFNNVISLNDGVFDGGVVTRVPVWYGAYQKNY
ncbi:hypothetical protein FF1_040641 [Malus domestica]